MADVMLRNVRLSFPERWNAREYKPGDGKPRWSASFLIEPGSDNDKAVQAAIKAEAEAQWKDKAGKTIEGMKGNSNKFCYTPGDAKDYDGYSGMMCLATHRSAKLARPAIVDRDKSPLVESDGKPYAGCYVNAKVSIYTQAGENAGVRASFSAIQFAKDGEPFGAGAPSVDDFDVVEDAEDTGFGF